MRQIFTDVLFEFGHEVLKELKKNVQGTDGYKMPKPTTPKKPKKPAKPKK